MQQDSRLEELERAHDAAAKSCVCPNIRFRSSRVKSTACEDQLDSSNNHFQAEEFSNNHNRNENKMKVKLGQQKDQDGDAVCEEDMGVSLSIEIRKLMLLFAVETAVVQYSDALTRGFSFSK
ncbi:unnamed protein product [Protopolystoma xenopodis]|uniref:Uncharacterized protein n=1 Tax=Protopolystoma xenopodis TaxID=117903 RepID=A0A448XEW4_9PLAT|nr:unnamed protein product [Protopolystoma xenopodis]